MRIAKSWVLSLFTIVVILGGFEHWATKAKERQWYWLRGDADHMIFADLLHKQDGNGHLLTVERNQRYRDEELDVNWSCSPPMISFPVGWTVERDLVQINRVPPPRDWQVAHTPKNPMERAFLELACKNKAQPPVFRLNVGHVPADVAKRTFDLMEGGTAPYVALRKAAEGK